MPIILQKDIYIKRYMYIIVGEGVVPKSENEMEENKIKFQMP